MPEALCEKVNSLMIRLKDHQAFKFQAPYDLYKTECYVLFLFQMDFLYKLFSDSNSQAIKVNRKQAYTQISLCCRDASVTKVPILKKNAGVTLVILNAVKAIKFNKDEFQELANHAANLIVGIWRSYKKSKAPEQWLSPPLRDILRGLLEHLNSLRIFVEDQVSTNWFLRAMGNSIDMQQISRYHQRLTTILNKFEIQSHITTSRLLIQVLERQKQMSNEIRQERNGVKNGAKRITDKNSRAKMNEGFSERRKSIRFSPRAGSSRASKRSPKKVTRKGGRHTANINSKFDWRSEAEGP